MSFRRFPSSKQARSRSRIPRSLVVVLLALQALVWGGGSIIEAKAAAESLTRYSHVEDQGTTACPPIHSHLDCLICRTFSSGAITARSRELVPPAASVFSMPLVATVGSRGDGCAGPMGSRAPPAV